MIQKSPRQAQGDPDPWTLRPATAWSIMKNFMSHQQVEKLLIYGNVNTSFQQCKKANKFT